VRSHFLSNFTVIDGSSETFSLLTLGPPKRMPVTLKISAQLLKQANFDIETMVQAQILRSIGSAIDLYCLNSLLALTENSGGSQVTMGGAATYTKLVSMKQTVLANNSVDDGSFGWIISPATFGRWSVIPQVSTFPRYLLDKGETVDSPIHATNSLTAATVPHTALFGRWSDAVLGIFGIDILSDLRTGMSANQIYININVLYDFGVLRGPSIIKTEDSAAQ
jgi:HK97 family phage major capsid protein